MSRVSDAGVVAEPSPPLHQFTNAIRRHLADGQTEMARSKLLDAKTAWPDSPYVLFLEAQIVEAEGQPEVAAELFRRAARAFANETAQTQNGNRMLSLAHAHFRGGEMDEAESALTLAKRHDAEPLGVLRLERSLAAARKDAAAMRTAAEAVVSLDVSPRAQDYVALALACRDSGDLDAAAAAAARAKALDPSHFEASRIVASIAMQRGDVEAAISAHRDVAVLAPLNPRPAFQLIRLLVLVGRVAEGEIELNRALVQWPSDPLLRSFALVAGFRTPEELETNVRFEAEREPAARKREENLRQLAASAPRDGALLRLLIKDIKSKEVIISQSSGADAAVLVFSALIDGVSMPLAIFDRYLASMGLTAIYLKDFQRLHYLNGIASLGDTYDTTIAALRDLCAGVKAKRVFAIGTSTGGFAAIRYGVELGVERVLSFAGETHDARRPLSLVDQGVALIRGRLAQRVPPDQLDLRRFLMSRTFSTKIELLYPQEAEGERSQALHLSGIEGIAMHPVAGCDDHDLLRWMALREDLTSILRNLLRL